jgi:hypothetical protein
MEEQQEFEQQPLFLQEEPSHEINNYELALMRDTIESMSKFNQIEVLRIMKSHKEIVFNENKYGVHINLSDVKPVVLEHLKYFIQYVQIQENNLNNIEQQKETFKNTFFQNNK